MLNNFYFFRWKAYYYMDPEGGRGPAACNLCKTLTLEGNLNVTPKLARTTLAKESFCNISDINSHKKFVKGGLLDQVLNEIIYSTVYARNASFDISVYDSLKIALDKRQNNFRKAKYGLRSLLTPSLL